MTVLVRIICSACGGNAGTGVDSRHALANVVELGGRVFQGVGVCSGCAEVTR